MFDYLISHALSNVWCTPGQDNQLIIKPTRVTPINGVRDSFRVMWSTIELPESGPYFHLYQVGQIHPLLVNLFAKGKKWVTLAEACEKGKNICDIYTSTGVQLPRTQTWYRVTEDNNIFIAVKKHARLPYDFNGRDMYVRLYSNEYFASTRSTQLTDSVIVQGGVMHTIEDILTLQAQCLAKTTLPGGMYAFVNGYKVRAINLVTTKVGDVAEYVYDSSILRVLDFKIDTLPTFDSVLDSKGKYLLHYAGSDNATIDYNDDIDVFVVDSVTQKGVYVHKNAGDTLRNLTHRDYAIPVAYVNAYLQHFAVNGVVDVSTLYLRLHVRKSGYLRPLILEHGRIHELYKLPENDLSGAMLGVDSNVAVWRAPALESAGYPEVMRSSCCEITKELVQRAYGYNAVAKLVADTPVLTRTNVQGIVSATLPYLLAQGATVFEYDAQGLLIDWHKHSSGKTYICRSTQAHYVEAIVGEGSHTLDEVYDQSTVALTRGAAYRYYTSPMSAGVPSGPWADATGGPKYSANSVQAVWFENQDQRTMVRSDKKWLAYRLSLTMTDGLLLFPLTCLRVIDGVSQTRNLEVPLGELDVFLNGHSLIPGLDYLLRFPHIAIVNQKYLNDPEHLAQDVVVRFTGFCTPQMTTTASNEFGFVQHGKLSVNNRFDIHDGKVLRIVCDGRLQRREELVFAQESLTYSVPASPNGAPYLIRDIVVPLKELVDSDTYTYRQTSLAVDTAIADYLTLKLPEQEPQTVNPIAERYPLYSPFLSKIIYDLVSGALQTSALSDHYDDDAVRALCAGHLWLLSYDPIHVDNLHNPDYVVVHPHMLNTEINLDFERYRFLTRVVRLYGNNAVSLSSFVKLV